MHLRQPAPSAGEKRRRSAIARGGTRKPRSTATGWVVISGASPRRRQAFSHCAPARESLRSAIMLKRLGLGLLLVACSSESQAIGDDEAGGSSGAADTIAIGSAARTAGRGVAGSASGGGMTVGGGMTSAAAGATGGASVAGGGQGGSAGAAVAGSGDQGGSAVVVSAGTGGGPIASGGGASAGAAAESAGDSGSGGMATGGDGAGSAGAAVGGTGGGAPDPCAGVAHWSPTDKITDYTPRPPDAEGYWRGDLRVFGGILWAAQQGWGCQTYPGHDDLSGWLKIDICAGGPVAETAACQCSAGQCCDGCYLRPSSYFCGEVVRTAQCLGPVVNQCGGATKTLGGDSWSLFCDGETATECTRWGRHVNFPLSDCPRQTGCVENGDQASCVACN